VIKKFFGGNAGSSRLKVCQDQPNGRFLCTFIFRPVVLGAHGRKRGYIFLIWQTPGKKLPQSQITDYAHSFPLYDCAEMWPFLLCGITECVRRKNKYIQIPDFDLLAGKG
jgi:hypothetical protein